MKNRNFNPKTMVRANGSDIVKYWKIFWGDKKPDNPITLKVKYGSFYHLRTNGFVYIARSEEGELKIGGANSIEKRMKQLRLQYGEMTVVAFIHADQYMYLERFLHRHLKDLELRREWYPDNQTVFDEVRAFIKKHGVIFGADKLVFL